MPVQIEIPYDEVRLRHILDMARLAQTFVEGKTRESLSSDIKLSLALARVLEIVDATASRVSLVTREASPRIPWSSIIGIRDNLLYDYTKVDHDAVWDIITHDLPPLIVELEKIIPPDGDESANEE